MLKCLTITGADDGIQPVQLFELSKEFPFVEWGILLSKKQRGRPRYPSSDWLDVLGTDYHLLAEKHVPAQFSLHLCGEYVRQLIMGDDQFAQDLGSDLLEVFKRIQVNTHGENLSWQLDLLADVINEFPEKEFIFQLDGNGANEAMIKLLRFEFELKNVSFLMDCSHGGGILPAQWCIPPVAEVSTGYAGGLGADNLEAQYALIKKAVEVRTDFTGHWWMDMETKVREFVADHEVFSLEKVREVLEIAKIWFPDPIGVVGDSIPVERDGNKVQPTDAE